MRQIDGDALLDQLGLDYLKRASTLGALSDLALRELMSKGRVYELNAGDTLFEAGEAGGSFFVVLKGTLAFYQPLDGHSEHIRDFKFGEEIGFVSMVALVPRPGTGVAVTDTCVVEIDGDLFYSLQCEYPLDFGIMMMNLAREMARRIVSLARLLAEQKQAGRPDSDA